MTKRIDCGDCQDTALQVVFSDFLLGVPGTVGMEVGQATNSQTFRMHFY
jgi:hypothetical protein